MGKSETFVDRNNVSDTITGVEYDTSGTTGRVKREDSLDGDVESRRIEGLENNLCHLLAVRLRIDWSFGKKDWVLLGGNAQFIVEGVVPNLFHVIPVCDDAVLNRVSQRKNTTL